MDVVDTITHPWRNPIEYLDLVLWVVVFVIIALALYDGMRIIGTWVKQTVS